MDPEDFTALGMLGKVRSTAHRRMTAYTVRADQCHECGLFHGLPGRRHHSGV